MLSGHLINVKFVTFVDVANLECPFRIFLILNDASAFGVMKPFISGDGTTAVLVNDVKQAITPQTDECWFFIFPFTQLLGSQFFPSFNVFRPVGFTPYFNPAPPKKSSTHFCCFFLCSGVALIASQISVFALKTNSSRLIFPFLFTSRKLNMCLCRASHFGLSKSGSVLTSAYLL